MFGLVIGILNWESDKQDHLSLRILVLVVATSFGEHVRSMLW